MEKRSASDAARADVACLWQPYDPDALLAVEARAAAFFMTASQLEQCLVHLLAVETIMVASDDFPGLARLSLVIDRLRAEHGLPARVIADLDCEFPRTAKLAS